MTKAFRHARIAEILRRGPVPGQQELARRMRAAGVRVSQATLSRDLREMGVIRASMGYALGAASPTIAAASDAAETERTIRQFVRSVAPAGNLAVVRTDPGCAHPLGVAIDASRWKENVGSVAGDDTLFVAAPSASAARRIVRRIRRIVA